MRRFIVPLIVSIFAPAAVADPVASERTVSADGALAALHAALDACRKEGQHVSVTVVDASGRVKASVRDEGAAPHTEVHSFRKAFTALSYRMTSAEVGKRAAEAKGANIGPQLLPNMTTSAGGVPIKVGDTTIGAVGVSGTPSSAGGGEGDARCAAAGASAVK